MSNTIIHKRSSVITDGKPKLPSLTGITYGELAINYADGVETLAIKNSNNEIVEFKSKEYFENIIVENEEISISSTKYGNIKNPNILISEENYKNAGIAMNEHLLYSSAKNSPKFCKQFVLSFLDMANVNFSLENVNKVFEKWNRSTELYGTFFEHRFDYIVSYMAEEFNLTGTLEDVTLKVNDTAGGTIQLNTTTPDVSDGSWTGKYYTDYSVTATAIPADGYEFVGWSGSVTSDSVTIEAEVVTGGITIEAVFERSENN